MSEPLPSDDEIKRKALFVPCDSKEALHRWIRTYLHLDIPDCLVDPQSTASPMDVIWEIYDKALRNDDPDFSRVLAYASRGSFKTLGAAILEVLAVVHLQRDVAHMAAIEGQAHKAQSYVKKFFNKPFLREFVVGNNKRELQILRYHDSTTGDNLSQDKWLALPGEAEKDKYQEIKKDVKIVVCTMAGANSDHVPFFVVDEIDVVPNVQAYEDSKMIPDPIDGINPITLLTSTRKFSFGLVQKEIDESVETGLHIRHWNLMDVTERCPVSRHRPDLPRLPIYRSDETLRAISEESYNILTSDAQAKYVKDEGYAGCLQNCKLFAVCQTRLADKQTSTSSMLKPITHTINQFRTNSVPKAKAQLLCWKPSTEGLIYSSFDRDLHMLTPGQMAEMITGEKQHPGFSKAQLLNLMKQRELGFAAGMDFGYTHNFSVVVGARDGNRMFIIDCISQAELEPSQQVELCNGKIKDLDPIIFADTENPQMIKTLKRAGFRMKEWSKIAGSVIGGIEIVRMKLLPAMGDPQLFFLQGDDGCELLAKRLSSYHWKLDAAGKPSKDPDDTEDDECDSLRYLVMNIFAPKGKLTVAKSEPIVASQLQQQYTKENWVQKVILEHTGQTEEAPSDAPSVTGKKGGFSWSFDNDRSATKKLIF